MCLAFDTEAAYNILETLRSSLNSPSSPRTYYVIFDSITPIISPLLNAVSSQGHATMTTYLRQLHALSETFSLSIFIINDTSNATPYNPHSIFSTTVKKPALGPSFTFLTDATIWLSRFSEKDRAEAEGGAVSVHMAEIFRSKTSRSRTWCNFIIQGGRILVDN